MRDNMYFETFEISGPIFELLNKKCSQLRRRWVDRKGAKGCGGADAPPGERIN